MTEIVVNVAYIRIDERPIILTRAIARQFEMRARERQEGCMRAEGLPPAILKVRASAIESSLSGWFVLWKDEEIDSLVWSWAAAFDERFEERLRERHPGIVLDDLSKIPTVVLK